jgi:deoxyribodipyrimidine photo-lyase
MNRCGDTAPGLVLYWMSRDPRAADNWALLHAQREALTRGVPLVTAFCLVPVFLGATLRQ